MSRWQFNPADLDREVTFESRATAQESVYGTQTGGAWAPLSEDPGDRAQVREMLPSRAESVEGQVSQSVRRWRVRMRWREDITGAMRIVLDDGLVLRIVSGPAELGRRDGMEMMCEQFSTEGEAP